MERRIIICWAAAISGLLLVHTFFLLQTLKISQTSAAGLGDIGVKGLIALGELQKETKSILTELPALKEAGNNPIENKETGIPRRKIKINESNKELLEKGTYSIHANIPTTIRFENQTGKTAKIYWLDYSGNRKLYKVLAVGQAFDQKTYVTHPWLITGDDDRAMQIYFPDSQARTVTLSQAEDSSR